MYDGNQVLRFENKFKASDLGRLGIELTERKGTGNYDTERTKFNIQYIPLTNKNLKIYETSIHSIFLLIVNIFGSVRQR